jgi:hypothetical protein
MKLMRSRRCEKRVDISVAQPVGGGGCPRTYSSKRNLELILNGSGCVELIHITEQTMLGTHWKCLD